MDALASTGRWTAAARARESERGDSLFRDPYAAALAGEEGFALFERLDAGENPFLPVRTRFFDDFLMHVTNTFGIRQVVLVAAGMDVRAFRLHWNPDTHLYELDQPAVLEAKAATLSAAGAWPNCHRHAVGVDLRQDWEADLCDAGYDRQARSVWLVEGLLQYLDESVAHALLGRLARLALSGSWLGADVVSRELLESPWMQSRLATLADLDMAWRFGTDDPEGFFGQHGWAATVIQPGEPEANYDRWSYPVAPREMQGIPRSFLARARRM
jgi:methyltransferase (TIGR00027 family)